MFDARGAALRCALVPVEVALRESGRPSRSRDTTAAGRYVDTPGIRSGAGWLGRDDGLTERESEVLQLCADGMSNREIAEHLYVNVETVKSHLKHAYSRLGLRNRGPGSGLRAPHHRRRPDPVGAPGRR